MFKLSTWTPRTVRLIKDIHYREYTLELLLHSGSDKHSKDTWQPGQDWHQLGMWMPCRMLLPSLITRAGVMVSENSGTPREGFGSISLHEASTSWPQCQVTPQKTGLAFFKVRNCSGSLHQLLFFLHSGISSSTSTILIAQVDTSSEVSVKFSSLASKPGA